MPTCTPLVTLTRLRMKLRREGWTCAVSYETCKLCGQVMTNNMAFAGKCTRHAECLPAADETFRAILTDRHRYLPKAKPRHPSLPGSRIAVPWTDEDDAIVIARGSTETTRAVAHMLDRTEPAIRSRRAKLRLEGRID